MCENPSFTRPKSQIHPRAKSNTNPFSCGRAPRTVSSYCKKAPCHKPTHSRSRCRRFPRELNVFSIAAMGPTQDDSSPLGRQIKTRFGKMHWKFAIEGVKMLCNNASPCPVVAAQHLQAPLSVLAGPRPEELQNAVPSRDVGIADLADTPQPPHQPHDVPQALARRSRDHQASYDEASVGPWRELPEGLDYKCFGGACPSGPRLLK
jgi:hypothetical protein